ncbi:hypothetical protein GF322_03710 [Candidatus Dependentiae bacterium]|nr:hypothetical protein [Candidatus Dependentiae bacterium]
MFFIFKVMKISIITIFPEIFDAFFKISLVARAIEKGLIEFNIVRFSDIVNVKQRIDEPTCGPGSGMILKPAVVQHAIEKCENQWGKGYKVFFSPQGKKLDQRVLKKLAIRLFSKTIDSNNEQIRKNECTSKNTHLILICPRYEGMDHRVEQYYADLIISIGDYVLMGGDIPAQVFLEGLLRYLPDVVGKKESVRQESFSSVFLDYPEYGLPVEWKNLKIPEIVLSGNHAQIDKWRKIQAAKKTIENRFDWFTKNFPSVEEIKVAKKFIPNHYVALMHTQVIVKNGMQGNTSIASLDIHDIARSSATYGIENYFVVTKLQDQKKILDTFLDFWLSNVGKKYNKTRFQAVSKVRSAMDFDDVLNQIRNKEKKEPLVIATSAKDYEQYINEETKIIDYFSQGKIFKRKRPVLIVLGTGQGLSESIIARCDYLLLPIKGMSEYNHLSVRSAAAIILDRWLGLNGELVDK